MKNLIPLSSWNLLSLLGSRIPALISNLSPYLETKAFSVAMPILPDAPITKMIGLLAMVGFYSNKNNMYKNCHTQADSRRTENSSNAKIPHSTPVITLQRCTYEQLLSHTKEQPNYNNNQFIFSNLFTLLRMQLLGVLFCFGPPLASDRAIKGAWATKFKRKGSPKVKNWYTYVYIYDCQIWRERIMTR